MSEKLYNKQKNSEHHQDSSALRDVIYMYDNEGNCISISRLEYQKKILPNTFEEAKHNPDHLYVAIARAMQEGFFQECLAPAMHLFQIDLNKERSTVILGIALMKNNKLDDAQEVLENYLIENGGSGLILTNLAKVFSEKKSYDKSLQTLWKALKVDPNQDNALDWWGAIHRDTEGEDGFYRAIERAAHIPGSWRPQLWLARRLLEQKKISSATLLYRGILEVAHESGDALTMISGDLGNGGYLIQMLDLILPIYNPEKHGPMAGLNLIQACIHLRNKETGLGLCESISKLQRYDIRQCLDQLREQLEKM